jgi:hypothetical protein
MSYEKRGVEVENMVEGATSEEKESFTKQPAVHAE